MRLRIRESKPEKAERKGRKRLANAIDNASKKLRRSDRRAKRRVRK